ncbi:uncharacterized protein LOC111070838 [Drosophila obscura]|uniref:uncharacterized protein LOC111070838 n=1 Tax=Drosophila obscura TaxID=7282 RepID=UPI001BB27A8D|nr:uncharacterized protein LOC111070838 [Drosophila obscura]
MAKRFKLDLEGYEVDDIVRLFSNGRLPTQGVFVSSSSQNQNASNQGDPDKNPIFYPAYDDDPEAIPTPTAAAVTFNNEHQLTRPMPPQTPFSIDFVQENQSFPPNTIRCRSLHLRLRSFRKFNQRRRQRSQSQ